MNTHDWNQQVDVKDRTVSYFVRGMRTLWELLGRERVPMGFVVAITVVTTLLEVVFAYCLKLAFDALASAEVAHTWNDALLFAVFGLAFAKVTGVLLWRFVREPILIKSMIRLENYWPTLAHEKMLALTLGFHERTNTGRQVAKIQKGSEKLMDILNNIMWGMLHSLLYLTFSVITILLLDWRLGLLFLVPIVVATLVNLRSYEKLTPAWETWEKHKEHASGLFFQSLINIATVQSYSQEARERMAHADVRQEMVELDTKTSTRMQWYFFAVGGVLQLFYLITIIAGIHFVVRGEVSAGTIVFIATTGGVVIGSVWEIIHVYSRIMRNIVSAERMKALMDEVPDIVNSPHATVPAVVHGDLAFEGVSFAHGGKEEHTVSDITLTIPAGSLVAFVGRSGAGKTTLVRLLARVYDVTSGVVTLDGVDIRTLDMYFYRRLFAFVSQDIEIFDATLRENVTYAYPDTNETIIQEALTVAHLAGAVGDVSRFPKGVETEVGERGVRLSGGERQRVGIARAYVALRNGARVLVLDEATSNLDSESERAIQEMLEELRETHRFTTVAIAHRLSTIHKANMIVVLDKGRVAETGTHTTLVAQQGIYAQLVALQTFGEFRE